MTEKERKLKKIERWIWFWEMCSKNKFVWIPLWFFALVLGGSSFLFLEWGLEANNDSTLLCWAMNTFIFGVDLGLPSIYVICLLEKNEGLNYWLIKKHILQFGYQPYDPSI